jgi:hypothetical protein
MQFVTLQLRKRTNQAASRRVTPVKRGKPFCSAAKTEPFFRLVVKSCRFYNYQKLLYVFAYYDNVERWYASC